MFNKGDSIRFVNTGITAKIVNIGVDPEASDDLVRYRLHVSPDDIGLMFGDLAEKMKPPYACSVPVDNDKVKMVKIN